MKSRCCASSRTAAHPLWAAPSPQTGPCRSVSPCTRSRVRRQCSGTPNFTGFTIDWAASDAARGLEGQLPAGSLPGDVLFNGTGTFLAGTLVDTSQIETFTVGSGGLLTPAPTSPIAGRGAGPFGSEFRPTNPSQLFVSNAHGRATGELSGLQRGGQWQPDVDRIITVR